MTIAIDTLATMRKLEKAGFQTEQAEAVAEVVAHQGGDLATKGDIAGVRGEIVGVRGEIDGVRREIAVLRWMFGLHFGITLIMLGFVVAVALRVFEALPK